MPARLEHLQVMGWKAVKLANALIEVVVLPGKGADIYSFVDPESGIDVLMKTPWGLHPPGSPPRHGSESGKFLHNYEGAWQELLPNTGSPCTYDGKAIPLHGEVATLPWALNIESDTAQEACISLSVRCRQLPLELTRRMRLRDSSPTLELEETVRNVSDRQVSFLWGHHPVLGAPFLEGGCRMRVAPCTVHTLKAPFDPANAAYASGQKRPWPFIQSRDLQTVDLRAIPGPDADIHDHACLTDLQRGWVEVENPRLRVAFSLEWDPTIFRWINNWRPLGGSHASPLEGIYGLALEPWSSQSNLAAALATNSALSLPPRGTLHTALRATLRQTGSDAAGST